MFRKSSKAYQRGLDHGWGEASAGYLETVERLSGTIASLRAVQQFMCNSKYETLVVVSRKKFNQLLETGRYTLVEAGGTRVLQHVTASGTYLISYPSAVRKMNLSEVVA